MKRLLLLSLTFALMGLSLQAIRPLRPAFTKVQSDGSTLQAFRQGDGHVAFYTTTDGQVLVKNAAGDLCYARRDGGMLVSSDIVAHEAGQRTAAETEYLRTNAVSPADAAVKRLAARRAPRRACYASTADGLGKYGQSGMGAVNSIGQYTIPVIMVQFSDLKFKNSTTKAKMTRFYNEEGYHDEAGCVGSVRDYFKSQSRSMFVPTFEIVATVTLDKGYAYYGGNETNSRSEWYGYDKGLEDDNYFVVESIQKAVAAGVDFKKYVVNGGVPLVSILYAGRGEATEEEGQGDNYIWPCEFDIDQTISGVHFNSYFVGNEIYYDGSLMGMGVFCHEFGHALGLPDFYVTDYSYEDDDPFSDWSIMDTGAYVNDTRAPVGYTAYERSYLGWLDIPELTEAGKVTLDDPTDEEGTMARLIRIGQKEYFILENRQPGVWYPEDHGSGLLLTRFAYDKDEWDYNELNNTQSKKRAMAVTANGAKMSYTAKEAHLYGNNKKDITSLKLYSGSSSTKYPVYGITKNADGTITFNYLSKSGESEPGEEPTVDPNATTATFDFLDGDGYGMELMSGGNNYNSDDVECVEGNVTLVLSGGNTRWWAAKLGNQLRMYKGSTASFSVPEGWYITGITVTAANSQNFSLAADKGAWSASGTKGTWTGRENAVTLSYGGTKNCAQISTIDVTLEAPTTGVGTATVVPAGNAVYDLQGRRVSSVQRGGVYIVGGKKVIL